MKRAVCTVASFVAVAAGMLPAATMAGAEAAIAARWSSGGPFGSATVVGTSATDEVYAVTGAALYRTTDGAKSWNVVTHRPPIPIGHLVVAPSDPSHLYAMSYAVWPSKPVRSSDGGKTWVAITSPCQQTIDQLAVDPTDGDTAYATCTNGPVLSKTTDGGMTWTGIDGGLPESGTFDSVAVDPVDPDAVYVSTTYPQDIFGSTDGGLTWNRIAPFGGDITISNDGRNVFVAFGQLLYRSTDGGRRWSVLCTLPRYVHDLIVATADPDLLYGATQTGIVMVRDGTARFHPLSTGFDGFVSLAVDRSDPRVVYAGVQHPDEVLRSSDAGHTWTTVNQGLKSAAIRSIAVSTTDPLTAWALPASDSFGRLFVTHDGGASWQTVPNVPSGDVVSVATDPENPDGVYAGIGAIRRVSPASITSGVYRTADGGATWQPPAKWVRHSSPGWGISVDPSSATVYAEVGFPCDGCDGATGIAVSRDRGEHWSSQPESGGGQAPIVSALSQPGTAWASRYWGGLLRTTDDGATWQYVHLLENPEGDSAYVQAVLPDAADPNVVYAATWYDGVAKTTDGGATWHVVKRGGAPRSVTAFAQAPNDSRTIYAATPSSGVVRSTDGGETWAPFNAGLNTRDVETLAMSADGSILYAGTLGGGVYQIAIGS